MYLSIYLPNIYLYTHSHIHIHSHRYLIRGKVQYWASLLTRGKELPANAGDMTSIPGSGRCPGEGNGNPSPLFLGNPMDRGAWRAPVYGVSKSQAQLSG